MILEPKYTKIILFLTLGLSGLLVSCNDTPIEEASMRGPGGEIEGEILPEIENSPIEVNKNSGDEPFEDEPVEALVSEIASDNLTEVIDRPDTTPKEDLSEPTIIDDSDEKDEDLADEGAILPTHVSGAFLTFQNAKVGCDFTKSAEDATKFSLQCQAMVQDSNGNRFLAGRIEEGLTISWNEIVTVSGNITEKSCQTSENLLSQVCQVTAPNQSAEVELGFSLEKLDQSRSEKATVLLPFQVRVAAGFLPKAPFLYLTQTGDGLENLVKQSEKKETAEKSGVVKKAIQPNQMVNFRENTCFNGTDLFFFSGEQIYQMDASQNINLFAGATINIDKFKLEEANHRIDLKVSDETTLLCLPSKKPIAIDPKISAMHYLHENGSILKLANVYKPDASNLPESLPAGFFDEFFVFVPIDSDSFYLYQHSLKQLSTHTLDLSKPASEQVNPALPNIGNKIVKGILKDGKLYYITSEEISSVWHHNLHVVSLLDMSVGTIDLVATLSGQGYFQLTDSFASDKISIVKGVKSFEFVTEFVSTSSSQLFDLDLSSIAVNFDSPNFTENTNFINLKSGKLDEINTKIFEINKLEHQHYIRSLEHISGTSEYLVFSTNALLRWNKANEQVVQVAGKTLEVEPATRAVELALSTVNDMQFDPNGVLYIAEARQPISKLQGEHLVPVKPGDERKPFGTVVTDLTNQPSLQVDSISFPKPTGPAVSHSIDVILQNGDRHQVDSEGNFSSKFATTYPILGDAGNTINYEDQDRNADSANLIQSSPGGGAFITTINKSGGWSGGSSLTATAYLYQITSDLKIKEITRNDFGNPNLSAADGLKLDQVELHPQPDDFIVLSTGEMLIASQWYLAHVAADLTISILMNSSSQLTFTPEDGSDAISIQGALEIAAIESQNLVLFGYENRVFQLNYKTPSGTLKEVISKSDNKACSSTFLDAKATEANVESAIKASLSNFCMGIEITNLAAFDGCATEKKNIKIAFSQKHAGGYTNLIEIDKPCVE